MHTTKVLHKLFTQSIPSMHSFRRDPLLAAVDSLACGAMASVTSLGRGLAGYAYGKHKIKRMDRLLSNRPTFIKSDFQFIRS